MNPLDLHTLDQKALSFLNIIGQAPDPATTASITASLALKANIASPTFTGDPKAPTPAGGDNDTSIATTAFVQGELSAKANIASPTFTGDPKAPTPSGGDNDTSIATTAFVQGELAAKANLASPVFTGDPKAPTPSAGDNDTSIATTAFVATSFAPLASPVFTGNPTGPTPSVDDNDTSIATTAYVIAQSGASNPLIDGTAAPGSSLRYSRQDHVHPTDTSRMPLTATFESSELAITTDTVISASHGLGRSPIFIYAFIRCKTAELNWAVGDEISVTYSNNSGGSALSQLCIYGNATTVGAAISDIEISNKSTFARSSITTGNWKMVFRAW